LSSAHDSCARLGAGTKLQLLVATGDPFHKLPQFCTFVAGIDDKAKRIGYDFSLRPNRKVTVWWSKSREEP
jgi:hypothetical protein